MVSSSSPLSQSKRYPISIKKVHPPEIIRRLTSGILFNLPPPVSPTTSSPMRKSDQQLDSTCSLGGDNTASSRTSTMNMPLHCMFEQVEEESTAAAVAVTVIEKNLTKMSTAATVTTTRRLPSFSPTKSTTTTVTGSPPRISTFTATETCKRTSSRKHKKLTLSAYHKPEETVRLTDCDARQQLENEYNLRTVGCKVIGHGAFSTVRSALRDSDGTKVAIKSISKFDALRARRLRRPKGSKHMDEWEIMKLLKNNPYVLTLFDVFETDTEIHLVTEFCRGGELFDAIKRKGTTKRSTNRRGRFSEPQAARITNQILKALTELHALGIVHRDIKAENILLLNDDESDIQVKLCDFGMARLHHQDNIPRDDSGDGEISPSTPGLLFGTNAPPEGFHGNHIGPATDVFSLGVTLYLLLCGFPPVLCEDVVEFPDAYWNDISDEAKDVVRSMLHHNPQTRISAVDALKNAWIRQQTTRVRRGSISANLELVRARLMRSLGDTASSSSSSSSLLPISAGKRSRRGSNFINTTSPKRSRICSFDIPTCSEKRDVRVIEERVEESLISGEERGEGMTCS
mmetsp:Transcript_20205/g.23317  ORF Transcript_20205/g.23317 Transcript_20205/m.23317 type:complete len:572 (+) Transcript_20205:683-2398(+)